MHNAEPSSNSAATPTTPAWPRGNARPSISRAASAATMSTSTPPPKKRIANMRLRRPEGIERATMSLYGTATMPLTKA